MGEKMELNKKTFGWGYWQIKVNYEKISHFLAFIVLVKRESIGVIE